jgi:predicted TIM-barrel fold metal-dependent hydrolase
LQSVADTLATATDWPVEGLKKSCDDICSDLGRAVADLTPAEQRALFHDNVTKYNRIRDRERIT